MQYWMGIESSCDETACAIVGSDLQVLSNPLYSQITEHAPWGGVVPEVAARAHLEKIPTIVQSALDQAGLAAHQIHAIAYTRGPGLIGPLLVGASFAQGLAQDLKIPCYGIHHLEGHMAAVHLTHPDLQRPYLALTVSGGHTELAIAREDFTYEILGRTRDDAAGEAFDKAGKLLGLGYPAGAQISQLALTGDPKFHAFPQGLKGADNFEFSFSGLKTAVLRYTQEHDRQYLQEHLPHICASLQHAIVEILVHKTLKALRTTQIKQLVLCGGVSANAQLRKRLQERCTTENVCFFCPQPEFSTDNGAMIAAAAILRQKNQYLVAKHTIQPWIPLENE